MDARTGRVTREWQCRDFVGRQVAVDDRGNVLCGGCYKLDHEGVWSIPATRWPVVFRYPTTPYKSIAKVDRDPFGVIWGMDIHGNVWTIDPAAETPKQQPVCLARLLSKGYAAFGSGRYYVGTRDGVVMRIDTKTCREKAREQLHTKGVSWMALTPDGKLLASFSSDPRIVFSDADTLEVKRKCTVPEGTPTRALFLSNERLLVGNHKGTLSLIDPMKDKVVHEVQGDQQFSLIASIPEERVLSVRINGEIEWWAVEKDEIKRLSGCHTIPEEDRWPPKRGE
jgi:hypothetical protein